MGCKPEDDLNTDVWNSVSGTYNGHSYVDLGLPSGTLWATCNMGAGKPEKYGDYFAWGETRPKEVYDVDTYVFSLESWSARAKYNEIDGLTVLEPSDDAATVNWGSGWFTPTIDQWKELMNHTYNVSTVWNGVSGRLFTAMNGNGLFLPAAGNRVDDYQFGVVTEGNYWSSSLDTESSRYAFSFYFDNSPYDGCRSRIEGFTVRPVCVLR